MTAKVSSSPNVIGSARVGDLGLSTLRYKTQAHAGGELCCDTKALSEDRAWFYKTDPKVL